jgi:hypothetical protein
MRGGSMWRAAAVISSMSRLLPITVSNSPAVVPATNATGTGVCRVGVEPNPMIVVVQPEHPSALSIGECNGMASLIVAHGLTPMTLCAHYCRDRSYANECGRHGAEEFRPLGRLFSPALSSCRLTDRSRLPFREVVKPAFGGRVVLFAGTFRWRPVVQSRNSNSKSR